MRGITFTWNRTHTIGLVGLLAWGVVLTYVVVVNFSSDYLVDQATSFPVWGMAILGGLVYGGVGLAVSNLVVGLMRTGSFSFPVASAALYAVMLLGMEFWHGLASAALADIALIVATILIWFSLTAALPYAIGHYGIRRIMLPRLEAGGRNRLERWALSNPLVAGSALAEVIIYALLIVLLCLDTYGFLFSISLMLFVPLGMMVVSGVAAAASPKTAVVLDAVSLLIHALFFCRLILISTQCYVGNTCVALPGGLFFNWNNADVSTIIVFGAPIAIALVIGGLIGGVAGVCARRRRAKR